MPPSFPLFNKIKDFSVFQTEAEESFSDFTPYKLKDQNNVETADNDDCIQYSFNLQKQHIKCPQLSFQSNFMHEHIQAFDYCVEKYLDQIFEGQLKGSKDFLNQSVFPSKSIFMDSPIKIMHYLKVKDCPLTTKNVQIFMEELIYQQKLMEFLHYICSKSCDQVALELIKIALQVWNQYLHIQHEQFTYQSLIQYSKNLVEQNLKSLKNKNFIKFINFQKTVHKFNINPQKVFYQERKLMEFLIVTFFLVICEYFNNPYFKIKIQSQMKNHLFYNNPSILYDNYQSFSDQDQSQDEPIFIRSRRSG